MQANKELLQKITKLDIGFQKLSTLPPEIALLVNLRVLNLAFNDLTQAPEWISSLSWRQQADAGARVYL
jgi:Leucine-rich repeat (LRR) protein